MIDSGSAIIDIAWLAAFLILHLQLLVSQEAGCLLMVYQYTLSLLADGTNVEEQILHHVHGNRQSSTGPATTFELRTAVPQTRPIPFGRTGCEGSECNIQISGRTRSQALIHMPSASSVAPNRSGKALSLPRHFP